MSLGSRMLVVIIAISLTPFIGARLTQEGHAHYQNKLSQIDARLKALESAIESKKNQLAALEAQKLQIEKDKQEILEFLTRV